MTRAIERVVSESLDLAQDARRFAFASSSQEREELRMRTPALRCRRRSERPLPPLPEEDELVSPRPGLYARAHYWEGLSAPERELHLLRTLATRHPGWVFCGPSAALAHGLDVPPYCLSRPHVVELTRSHNGGNGLVAHCRVRGDVFEEAQGMAVTSLERTLLDCLRAMDLRDGLAVADSALRQDLVTKDGFAGYCHEIRRRGLRGAMRARETISHASARAQSCGESVLRGSVIELGYALPELGAEVPSPTDPERMTRAPLAWRRDDGGWLVAEFVEGAETDGGIGPDRGKHTRRADKQGPMGLGASRGTGSKPTQTIRVGWAELADDDLLAGLLDSAGVPDAA